MRARSSAIIMVARPSGDSPPQHGFIYSGGIYTTIDNPSANFLGTSVTGINNLGQIVGITKQQQWSTASWRRSDRTRLRLPAPART